jgi:hypothetical protein
MQGFREMGMSEAERLLVRLGCRWEDNIKMDFQEVGRGRGLH